MLPTDPLNVIAVPTNKLLILDNNTVLLTPEIAVELIV